MMLGEWDVNDPSSTNDFSVIFNKARNHNVLMQDLSYGGNAKIKLAYELLHYQGNVASLIRSQTHTIPR